MRFDALRQWQLALNQASGGLRNLSNVVANDQEHLERIQMVVEQLHHCKATHLATIRVHDVFRGQTVWTGDVEEFELIEHPKAKRAYGWSEGIGAKERFFAVLELPPVESALTAVRASIVADAKKVIK